MVSNYAAFLSYSHSADRELSAVVQRGLQRLGKPWYRRPTIKIFRDEASLSANPGLWSSIEQSLAQCDYFLLLASPDSALSPWVAKEIQWWRTNRPHENLLIIVTDGQIAWDSQSRDFDWERTTCLSPEMKGLQREEPLCVDLRWVKSHKQPGLRNRRFRDAMLMLLAPIYGRPKDELDSEDIRQQRRFKFAAVAAGLVVVILALAALYGTWNAERNSLQAEKNRREAERNHRESESRRLSVASLEAMDKDQSIDRAIILGVLAWRIARTPEAEGALIKMQDASADVARILGQHTADLTAVAFSGDSSIFATGARDGSIVLWRVKDWNPTGTVLSGGLQGLQSMYIDQTGSNILAIGWVKNSAEDRNDDKMILWDARSRTYRALPGEITGITSSYTTAFSPNGKLVAGQIGGGLAVWDATTQGLRAQIRGTRVNTLRFIDDTNLFFVTYDEPKGRWAIRVGSWNLETGIRKLGPFAPNLDILDFTDTSQTFSGNGTKLLTTQNSDLALWTVQGDLSLRRLQRPDQLPRDVDYHPEVVFEREGTRVAIKSHARVLVWDLARNQVIKLLIRDYGGFRATLSPDGRWLAVTNGMNDASVVIWDLNITESQNPASSLQAGCNLQEADCIRRLCEKASLSIDENMLRDLVGDSLFEELDETLKTAPCAPG
jgi:WD40 repeat protein